MNMFGKKKNNAEASPAPADPPKAKQLIPPPPDEVPQLDLRPKKAKGDDGKSGAVGGFVNSMMGGAQQ